MDPPQHARVRRLVSKAFTFRSVDRLRSQIVAVVDGLLDEMAAAGPPVDLVACYASRVPNIVLCNVLGIPPAERHRLAGWVRVTMAAEELPPDVVGAAFAEASEYLLDLLARKRTTPGPDLMTALVEAHDGGDRLTESELLQTALGLFAAGQDTTTSLLANSLVTLFRHPDQLALLVARPELVPAAVEELLRYVRFTPALFTRIATEDVDLGAVTIRDGEAVLVSNHSANRDPAVFEDPDQLRLDRSEAAAHLAFGYGPHFCAGAALARAELQIAVGSLVARFPTLRPAIPLDELEWRPGLVVRGMRVLPIAW